MLILVCLVSLIVVSPVTGFGEKEIRNRAIETMKKFYSPENLQLTIEDSERAQDIAEKMKLEFRLKEFEPAWTASEVTTVKDVIPDPDNRVISVISPKICGYIDSDGIAAEITKFQRIILPYLFGVTGIGIKFENRHSKHKKHDIRALRDWIRTKNYRYRLIFAFKYALQQHFDDKPLTKEDACSRLEKTTKSTKPTDHSDKDSSVAHRSNLKLSSVSAASTSTTQDSTIYQAPLVLPATVTDSTTPIPYNDAPSNPKAQDKIEEADQPRTLQNHSSNTNKTPSRTLLCNSNADKTDQSEITMKPEGLDEGETEGTSQNSNPNPGTHKRVIPQKGNDTNQQTINNGSTENTDNNNEIYRDAQLCSATPSSTPVVPSFTTTSPDNLSLSPQHFNTDTATFVKNKSQSPLEPLLPAGYKRTIGDPQLLADLTSHHTPAEIKPTESISPRVPSPESEISELPAIPKQPERSDAALTQRSAEIMTPRRPMELQVPTVSSPPPERLGEVMGTDSVQLTSPAVLSPESKISELAEIPKEPEISDADLTQKSAEIMTPCIPVEPQVPTASSPPTEPVSEVVGTNSVQWTSLVNNATQESQLARPTNTLIDYSLPPGARNVTETLGNTIFRKVSSKNTVSKVISRGNDHVVHRCQNPEKPFGFVLYGLVIVITVQVGLDGSNKYGLVGTEICGNKVHIVNGKVEVTDDNWIDFTLPEKKDKWIFKREQDDRVKFDQAVDHGLRAFVKLYQLPTTDETDKFRKFVQYLNPENGQPPYVTVAAQPFGKEDGDGEFVQLIIHISKDDRVQ